MGNLLLFAMVRIFCHSAILLSVESGSDNILLHICILLHLVRFLLTLCNDTFLSLAVSIPH